MKKENWTGKKQRKAWTSLENEKTKLSQKQLTVVLETFNQIERMYDRVRGKETEKEKELEHSAIPEEKRI